MVSEKRNCHDNILNFKMRIIKQDKTTIIIIIIILWIQLVWVNSFSNKYGKKKQQMKYILIENKRVDEVTQVTVLSDI